MRLPIGQLIEGVPGVPGEKEYRDSIPIAPATAASHTPMVKHKTSFLRLLTPLKIGMERF
jgi:hypothetical protein